MIETLAQPRQAAPLPVPRRYTYAQVCAELPETNQPCELWEGEIIMSPSPSFFHQEAALCFYRHLHDWVVPRRLGKVTAAPIDMVLSEHCVTQPDVAFITQARLAIIERVLMGPADLVAEIVSLGSRHRDRIEKRDLYEQYGVQEYWMIDPEARSVEVLFLEHGSYQLVLRSGVGQAAASRLLPGFEIQVDALLHGS